MLFSTGCKHGEPGGPAAEPYLSDEASVAFDLETAQGGSGASQQWIATYMSQGKTARFRIEIGTAKTVPARAAKEFDIKSGEGRFVPESGSDASVLLIDLQKALKAKALPKTAQQKAALPFTYADLGENLSQAAGGGFNTTPRGNWTAMKIFVGEGDQEGELFLNINAKIKKGQFSMKDPDYGDLVLAQLAKVL